MSDSPLTHARKCLEEIAHASESEKGWGAHHVRGYIHKRALDALAVLASDLTPTLTAIRDELDRAVAEHDRYGRGRNFVDDMRFLLAAALLADTRAATPESALDLAAKAVNYFLELTTPYPDGPGMAIEDQRTLQNIIENLLLTGRAEMFTRAATEASETELSKPMSDQTARDLEATVAWWKDKIEQCDCATGQDAEEMLADFAAILSAPSAATKENA